MSDGKYSFEISPALLQLSMQIERILGQLEGFTAKKPSPQLRKESRIKSIHSSLQIEGNTLNLEQVSDILDGKKVIGSKNEILEVKNAIKAYDQLAHWKPFSVHSFLQAHKILMQGLIKKPGSWRDGNVGIFQGTKVAHVAPQAKWVSGLMSELFTATKTHNKNNPLLYSALFHYEVEFIHPFTDGNGRMGRLWQTVLLYNYHPIFEFIPIESQIKQHQKKYYQSLAESDKKGSCEPFLEFSMSTILQALEEFSSQLKVVPLSPEDRLLQAQVYFKSIEFTRQNYLDFFKTLSSATASRDLALGVKLQKLIKSGDKRTSRYKF